MKVCASCLFLFFAGLSAGMSQYFVATNIGSWSAYLNTANTNLGPPYTDASIYGYSGSGGYVAFPSSIAGAPVKWIGGRYARLGITSVSIPGGADIAEYAFSDCPELTSLSIGDGVTYIGNSAFSNCTGLSSVTIPDSVTNLGEQIFGGCTNLNTISIGPWISQGGMVGAAFDPSVPHYVVRSGVTKIGDGAFSLSPGLISVSLPGTVSNIGNGAFLSCSNLVSVTIPGSVTSIGQYAFAGCGALAAVTIPGSVTNISGSAFSGSGLRSVTIPSSVTSIDNNAFAGCGALAAVTIPGSVTNISGSAFSGSGLRSVTIPSSVTIIGQFAFADCPQLTSAIIPASVEYLDPTVFYNCPNLKTVLVEGNYRYLAGLENASTVYYLPGATGWEGSGAQVFLPRAVQPLYTVATGFRFSWTGTGSMPMNVQRTTALGGPWTVVSSNNTTGQFIDPNTPVTKAFYRAVLP